MNAALDALDQLSPVVGAAINVYLKELLQPLNQKLANKEFSAKTEQVLRAFHQNGGDEALALIKTKIPTFAH